MTHRIPPTLTIPLKGGEMQNESLRSWRDERQQVKHNESPPPLRGRVREGGVAEIDRASHTLPPTQQRCRVADLPLKGGGSSL
jgi:hypothetical protein